MVCANDNYSKSSVFDRGEKAAEHLFDDMFKKEEYIKNNISFSGTPITEFLDLRSKMYSLTYDVKDGDTKIEKEKQTAKGIAKCTIDQQIRHLHYKQCLFDNKMTVNDMNLIRSQNHVLYVNNVRKIGLCNFDDKLFWKSSIHGYAYGHYKIPNIQKWFNVCI